MRNDAGLGEIEEPFLPRQTACDCLGSPRSDTDDISRKVIFK